MAYNQVAKYYQGYLSSTGQSGGIIAGLYGLLVHASTDIAGICCDYSGNVYVTDAIKHIVLKITEGGDITTLAGSSGVSGNNGNNTVTAYNSRFNYPTGITCDKNGDIYVCDTGNNQIRRISNNKVSLIAGDISGATGTANGNGSNAKFNSPYGIDVDYSGIIYVADTGNHSVRKIKGGVVTTCAGLNGTSGDYPQWANMSTAEGVSGALARFHSPYGITVNANGYIFVLDTDNNVIKRIDPAGRVRIFSGQSGVYGRGQGTAKLCSFQNLRYADVTRSEEIYVVDFDESGASRVMVINREGASYPVVYWTSGDEGKYLAAVTCNPAGHIIVAESEYTVYEYSSSSSTEYMTSSSSSSSVSSVSSSSVSSVSSSSNSSSSVSSESSSSSTEVQTTSSSSSSSNSSSSVSSSSVSSESSSSNSSSSVSSESSSSNSSSSVSSSSVSSESSSSVSSESSSSNSSSSVSSSSNSSSSVSSESSSSVSSESSESSSSISSESSSSSLSSASSSSISSESSPSSSSSSSSLQGCEPNYCATGYVTNALNGTYSWTGDYYNSKPIYNNGTYNLWYASGAYDTWAISSSVGTSPVNWLSSKTTTEGCPDGTYDTEAGTLAIGECSSSSSSSV